MIKSRSIYVAGGSSERLTVCQPLIDTLREGGWIITYDWTRGEGFSTAVTPDNATLSLCAYHDFQGIEQASVLWLVVPEEKSEGSAAELGIALALKKHTIVSGGPMSIKRNVFVGLADMRFDEHDYALDYLQHLRASA